MTQHKTCMIALDTLQTQANHTIRILANNGFASFGENSAEGVMEASIALQKAIDNFKKIVLLDGYDNEKVYVADPVS